MVVLGNEGANNEMGETRARLHRSVIKCSMYPHRTGLLLLVLLKVADVSRHSLF